MMPKKCLRWWSLFTQPPSTWLGDPRLLSASIGFNSVLFLFRHLETIIIITYIINSLKYFSLSPVPSVETSTPKSSKNNQNKSLLVNLNQLLPFWSLKISNQKIQRNKYLLPQPALVTELSSEDSNECTTPCPGGSTLMWSYFHPLLSLSSLPTILLSFSLLLTKRPPVWMGSHRTHFLFSFLSLSFNFLTSSHFTFPIIRLSLSASFLLNLNMSLPQHLEDACPQPSGVMALKTAQAGLIRNYLNDNDGNDNDLIQIDQNENRKLSKF